MPPASPALPRPSTPMKPIFQQTVKGGRFGAPGGGAMRQSKRGRCILILLAVAMIMCITSLPSTVERSTLTSVTIISKSGRSKNWNKTRQDIASLTPLLELPLEPPFRIVQLGQSRSRSTFQFHLLDARPNSKQTTSTKFLYSMCPRKSKSENFIDNMVNPLSSRVTATRKRSCQSCRKRVDWSLLLRA